MHKLLAAVFDILIVIRNNILVARYRSSNK